MLKVQELSVAELHRVCMYVNEPFQDDDQKPLIWTMKQQKKQQQHTNRTAFFVRNFFSLDLPLFCFNLWFQLERCKYSHIPAIKFGSTSPIPNLM